MRVVEGDRPKPGPNQVLIEVKAAGINFAELELAKGKYPALKPLPYILGFEAAGIVAELGSQVKNVSVGDKITAIEEAHRGLDPHTRAVMGYRCGPTAIRE